MLCNIVFSLVWIKVLIDFSVAIVRVIISILRIEEPSLTRNDISTKSMFQIKIPVFFAKCNAPNHMEFCNFLSLRITIITVNKVHNRVW